MMTYLKCKRSKNTIRQPKSLATALLFVGISTVFLLRPATASDLSPNATVGTPSCSRLLEVEQITLADLYDTGLALFRIRQQAVNTYIEATRSPINGSNLPEITDPSTIPVSHENNNFLPARRDWLVCYVATMEPLIRMLANDVKGACASAQEVMLPTLCKSQWEPCWNEWATHVKLLNDHLTSLLAAAEDEHIENAAIANESVAIFEEVEKLEKIRKKAARLVAEDKRLQGCDRAGSQM
jgi:hypothetical protein